MVLALSEPEMSPREARRLETRVRREWERVKREWKDEGVGIGIEDDDENVVRRMKVKKRIDGEGFRVPVAMGLMCSPERVKCTLC